MGNCFSSNKEIPAASSMDPPNNILRICNQELEKILKMLVQIKVTNPFYETLLIFFDTLYQNMKNYSSKSEHGKRVEQFPIYSFKLQEISNILTQNPENPEISQKKISLFISYLEDFYKFITSSDFTFKNPFNFKNLDVPNQNEAYISFHKVESFLNDSQLFLEKQLFHRLVPDAKDEQAKKTKSHCVQAFGLWFQVFGRKKYIFWNEFPKFIRDIFEKNLNTANLNDDKVNLMREFLDPFENQVITMKIWERFYWEWLLVAGRRRELFSNRPPKRLFPGVVSKGRKLELIERKRENVEGSLVVNNKIILDNKGFRLYGLNKTRRDLFTSFVSFGEGGCDFPITVKRNIGIVAMIFSKSQEPDNFYLLNVSCKMHVKILFKANDLKEDELYFCEGQHFRKKSDDKHLEFYEISNSDIKTINTLNEKKFDWKKKVVWRLLGKYEEFIKSLDADDNSDLIFSKAYKLQDGDVIDMNGFVFKFGENTDDLDKEKRGDSQNERDKQKKLDENKLTDASQAPAILESIVLESLIDKNDYKSEKNSLGNAADLKYLENNKAPAIPESIVLWSLIDKNDSKSEKNSLGHAADLKYLESNENQENRSNLLNLPNDPAIEILDPSNEREEEKEREEYDLKHKNACLIYDAKVNECEEKVVETPSTLGLASPKENLNDPKPEIDIVPNEKENSDSKEEEPPQSHNLEEIQYLAIDQNENDQAVIKVPSNIQIDSAQIEEIHNLVTIKDQTESLKDVTNEENNQIDSKKFSEINSPDEHPNDVNILEEQLEEPLQNIDEAEPETELEPGPEPEFLEIPIKIAHYGLSPPLKIMFEIEHKKPYYSGRYADISQIYSKKRVSVFKAGLTSDLTKKLQRKTSTPSLPKTALVTNIFTNLIHKTVEKENEKKRIEDLIRFSYMDREEATKKRRSSTVILLSGKVVSEKLVDKIYILEELHGGVYPSEYKVKKEEKEPEQEIEFITENRPRRRNVKKRKNNLEFIAEEDN